MELEMRHVAGIFGKSVKSELNSPYFCLKNGIFSH